MSMLYTNIGSWSTLPNGCVIMQVRGVAIVLISRPRTRSDSLLSLLDCPRFSYSYLLSMVNLPLHNGIIKQSATFFKDKRFRGVLLSCFKHKMYYESVNHTRPCRSTTRQLPPSAHAGARRLRRCIPGRAPISETAGRNQSAAHFAERCRCRAVPRRGSDACSSEPSLYCARV